MTTIDAPKKSLSIKPLKISQPFGATLALLGLKGTIPLFHGSQGCTAFAKVLLVRHFREAIPLATTAMTEVTTILGGEDNIEQAILTLIEKNNPEIIGLFTTGLTETRGDDMKGILKTFRDRHPELDRLPIVFISTPDYKGAAEDGYKATVEQIVAYDYATTEPRESNNNIASVHTQPQITILAGSLLSPGDVREIKEIVSAFGLHPLVVPDLSESLDGHLVDEKYSSVTCGGTSLKDLKRLSDSIFTVAIGESMRSAAEILKTKFGTEYELFPSLAGLSAVDRFIWQLARVAASTSDPHFTSPPPRVPESFDRARRQLQDAILDSHFYFGRKKVCLALEPDLLYQTSWLLHEMGAIVTGAVTTTKSPILAHLPADMVTIGDLSDFEEMAVDADLLITNSHGKDIAKKLDIPLYRMGYPIFDRLGNGQRCTIGYRGTMQFLFDVGNIFLEAEETAINPD